jgi:5'-nucleotidase
VDPKDVTRFYVEELYPYEHKADVMAIAREKGFYTSMDPIDGAISALKDIEDNCMDFIEPFICTSPEVEFQDLMCHSEKVQWNENFLSPFWVKRTIITKDKTMIRGHFIIDDKPEIKGALNPMWQQIHYKQPYTPKDAKMVFDWSEWNDLREVLRDVREDFLKDIGVGL